MEPEDREGYEEEPELEPEDPAVTRRFRELESRQARPAVRRAPERPKRRNTAWLALLLLLASIYVFWVLPYQLGSKPVAIEFTQDKK